ncbi:MAG TPA: hypothetical protein VIK83_05260 [Coriobacteriia bacterium]
MAYMRGVPYIYVSCNGMEFDCCYTLPMARLDELVVMRYAEMTPQTRARAEKRAMARNAGNSGCSALNVKHGLPDFAARVRMLTTGDAS